MAQEVIPRAVALYPADLKPRLEFQGVGTITCTMFGTTSALEAMFARAGQPLQLSPRFIWYMARGQSVTIDNTFHTLMRYGCCLDSDCPYDVSLLDVFPGQKALENALSLLPPGSVTFEPVYGVTEMQRALAQGHALITIRNNGAGGEHCEAIIGYGPDGFTVHGSSYDIYTAPYSDVTNVVILKAYKVASVPVPITPAPDYIEGDLPRFDSGTLTIPQLDVIQVWPAPVLTYRDVVVHFEDSNVGTVRADDPEVYGFTPQWHSTRALLTLPTLMYLGNRYSKVSVLGASIQVVSFKGPDA